MNSHNTLLQRLLARQNSLLQGNLDSIKQMNVAMSSIKESFYSLRIVLGCIVAIICILYNRRNIMSMIANQSAESGESGNIVLQVQPSTPTSPAGNSNFGATSTPLRMTTVQEVDSEATLIPSSNV